MSSMFMPECSDGQAMNHRPVGHFGPETLRRRVVDSRKRSKGRKGRAQVRMESKSKRPRFVDLAFWQRFRLQTGTRRASQSELVQISVLPKSLFLINIKEKRKRAVFNPCTVFNDHHFGASALKGAGALATASCFRPSLRPMRRFSLC